jgi:hypothetical protein
MQRGKAITRVARLITEYTRPMNYSVECVGCRERLAEKIVDSLNPELQTITKGETK